MKESARYLSVAETAKLMRVALKAAFPATKFSVRSRRGSSIDVGWTDGPSSKRVKEITSGFEGGGFDGMIDMAFSYDHWLLPDGSTVLAYSPGTSGSHGMYDRIERARPHDDAELVHFGSKFVFENREISTEFAKRLVKQIADYVGGGTVAPELAPSGYTWGQSWKFADPTVGNQSIFGADKPWEGPHWTWECCVRRASEDATKFTHDKETA